MSEDEVVININKLYKSGLSVVEYFIAECINKGEPSLLEDYVRLYGIIDRSVFVNLFSLGYIEKFEGDIRFMDLKLTKKYYEVFGYTKIDHDKCFKELKLTYPKKVAGRSLHQNLPGCKKEYRKIVTSEDTHNTIIKCIKLYIQELQSSNRLPYIQLLPTFLNQRNFEQYYEEAEKLDRIEDKQNTYDSI